MVPWSLDWKEASALFTHSYCEGNAKESSPTCPPVPELWSCLSSRTGLDTTTSELCEAVKDIFPVGNMYPLTFEELNPSFSPLLISCGSKRTLQAAPCSLLTWTTKEMAVSVSKSKWSWLLSSVPANHSGPGSAHSPQLPWYRVRGLVIYTGHQLPAPPILTPAAFAVVQLRDNGGMCVEECWFQAVDQRVLRNSAPQSPMKQKLRRQIPSPWAAR